MIGYAVRFMADAVHPSEAPEMHPVLFLMLDDGLCSTPK